MLHFFLFSFASIYVIPIASPPSFDGFHYPTASSQLHYNIHLTSSLPTAHEFYKYALNPQFSSANLALFSQSHQTFNLNLNFQGYFSLSHPKLSYRKQ